MSGFLYSITIIASMEGFVNARYHYLGTAPGLMECSRSVGTRTLGRQHQPNGERLKA